MDKALILFLGGGIGTLLRYGISLAIMRTFSQSGFPAGTFAVNLAGCLMIGLLAGWNEQAPYSENLRLLLFTGLLGGFTTFSAFSLESLQLLRNGETGQAILYIAGSTSGGILLCLIGFLIARR